ncbi:hypothetical protein GWI33_014245 [Rhynchophorus ferrugineus]|uniref:Secreted protein n=1 Tax=Rhynchophorus ferrugineus TaxID=354439 RepID=A0A834I7K9_RHYFE|nr:hypothetical protein GWI33_014245 [Rhynchophorus ferrugineus]
MSSLRVMLFVAATACSLVSVSVCRTTSKEDGGDAAYGGGSGTAANDIATRADEMIRDADYDLKVLSKQVKVLVERRAEDLKSIEDSVRKTVFNGPEVEELKEQVRSLR